MNAIQIAYTEASAEYEEYGNDFENWQDEEDIRLYEILMTSETALVDWALGKALSVAFLNEKSQIAPVIKIYNNRNDSPKAKCSWVQISDKIIEAAMKLG